MEKKLNLGCGSDIIKDWINLDIADIDGVDIIHDIEQLPLPFDDNYFDFILCKDVLEHTEYIPILKDIHRILKPNGIVKIQIPHFTAANNFIDPTHKKMFSYQTFDYFVSSTKLGLFRNYYFDFKYSKIVSSKIAFVKHPVFFWNYVVEPLININNSTRTFYEYTFLSRLFPALNVEISIKK